MILWWSFLIIRMVGGLNRGQDAQNGEFPFVVRILISEKATAHHSEGQYEEHKEEPQFSYDDDVTGSGSGSGAGEYQEPGSGEFSGSGAGDKSGSKAGEFSGSAAGNKSGSEAGEFSGSGAQEFSGSGAGDTSGSGAGDTSGSGAGDTSGSGDRGDHVPDSSGYHGSGAGGHLGSGDGAGSRHDSNHTDEEELIHEHDHDHGGMVSAGVLITKTRVLTTCDSVGFFTGETVSLYQLDKVSIMAGSVYKNNTQESDFRIPTHSNVHPFCFFLSSMNMVLFNYGYYDVKQPFGVGTDDQMIQPVPRRFKNKIDMELTLRNFWKGYTKPNCVAVGWGNPSKQFEGDGMPDHFERFSSVLQKTGMKVVHYTECSEAICKTFQECLLSVWEYGFVCAKAAEGGPCNEDNGAPLICDGQVFAIHTNPHRCVDEGIPRLFLRLDLAFEYVFGGNGSSDERRIAGFTVLGAILIVCWPLRMDR